MSFLIQSLPQHGTIGFDIGDIVPAIDANSAQLQYAPSAVFVGLDSFEYLVNDGTCPPAEFENCNSALATVTIDVGVPTGGGTLLHHGIQ